MELLSGSKKLLFLFISRQDSQFAVDCSIYCIQNLSWFAVKHLGPKILILCAFRTPGVRLCDISVAVQKNGIHGNQKLKITIQNPATQCSGDGNQMGDAM